MDHQDVGKFWNENALHWTQLVRMGCDLYRDHVNAPAFFEMLPDVNGLRGLDIGCGEGYMTRGAAQRGANMTAIDISDVFIEQAKKLEEESPLGITYQVASAVELPFGNNDFDFAIAAMSLMDIAETERVIREAKRILRKGGFFQFSISHPCFSTSKWEWVSDKEGRKESLKCGD